MLIPILTLSEHYAVFFFIASKYGISSVELFNGYLYGIKNTIVLLKLPKKSLGMYLSIAVLEG